jgi:hypothetical protein
MLYGLCAYLSFCNCIHSVQIQFQTTAAHKKKTDTTSPPLREVGTEADALKSHQNMSKVNLPKFPKGHGLAQGLSPSLHEGLCCPSTLSHGPWTMFRMALRAIQLQIWCRSLTRSTKNWKSPLRRLRKDAGCSAHCQSREEQRWSLITLLSHFLEILVFQHW